LNSPKHEWIIGDVLSMPEYEAYMAEHAADFTYKVNPSLLDKAYDVRDFALNNVMVMIAADGKFDAEEEKFATEMARKYGFSVKQLAPMFEMAKQGRLVVKMPEDRKQRERIYKLMVKAANADNEVAPEEQKLLDAVRAQFLPENEEEKKEAESA
jgi:tellurite resistance protein